MEKSILHTFLASIVVDYDKVPLKLSNALFFGG